MKRLTLGGAINEVISEYEKAKDKEFINKPLSYALYQTWKHVNAIEKPRKHKEE